MKNEVVTPMLDLVEHSNGDIVILMFLSFMIGVLTVVVLMSPMLTRLQNEVCDAESEVLEQELDHITETYRHDIAQFQHEMNEWLRKNSSSNSSTSFVRAGWKEE
jgi:hypothetical protein